VYYRNNYIAKTYLQNTSGLQDTIDLLFDTSELKRLRGKGDIWADLQKQVPLERLFVNVRLSPYGCTDLGFREIYRAVLSQPHHVKRITRVVKVQLSPTATR